MKSEIRSRILNEIKSLTPEQKTQKSLAIQTQLENLLKNQKGPWAAYQSLSDEPVIN